MDLTDKVEESGRPVKAPKTNDNTNVDPDLRQVMAEADQKVIDLAKTAGASAVIKTSQTRPAPGRGSHPGAATKRPDLGSLLKIRFCNPSTFGPPVRDYVASLHNLKEVVLHAWAETHIPATRIGDW